MTKQHEGSFPFDLSARGQLITDPTLRLHKHARVFALGDVSGTGGAKEGGGSPGGDLPATAQVAFQQADYAAWNLWAAINGRPLLPFRYIEDCTCSHGWTCEIYPCPMTCASVAAAAVQVEGLHRF